MWTTAGIRRQIAKLTSNKPFSIRDFLAHGSRAAVDRAFCRLVANGEIIRVARGLYIKKKSPFPSLEEVAIAKAAAFKRTIAMHGSQAASYLKLKNPSSDKHVFASSGRSSSFRFGDAVIYFVGTCQRKMHLANTPAGLAMRALWHLGKEFCTMYTASKAVASFGRSERQELKNNISLMPGWMQACFLSINRYWQEKQRMEHVLMMAELSANRRRGSANGTYAQDVCLATGSVPRFSAWSPASLP